MMMVTLLRTSTKGSRTVVRMLRLTQAIVASALVASACSAESLASEGTITLGNGSIAATEPDDIDPTSAGPDDGVVNFRWDTFDGSTKAFSDFEPMPTVLNFFASWCPPCIAEMPNFEAVSQQMAGWVRFIGLATQDDPASAALLIEETGVSYEVGPRPKGQTLRDIRWVRDTDHSVPQI